jgi:hypothetical protein
MLNQSTASISFTPPANPGSSPIIAYWVTATPTSGSGDPIVVRTTSSPAIVTGLQPNVDYTFEVQAQNEAAGIGPSSATPSPP